MKKRRRLEQDEALPLVCRLPTCIKWEGLCDGSELLYKQRSYTKGVPGMEEKLLTAMANNLKKKVKVGGGGGGGCGGNGNGHEKSQSSNNIPPPAISQIDIEGTMPAYEYNQFDVSLDAANCNNVTGG